MGEFVVLVSFGVFVWAAVGLVSPKWAKLPGRGSAVGVWALSVLLLLVGGSLLPEPPASPSAGDFTSPVPRAAPADGVGTARGGLTLVQRNAVRSANQYLRVSGFSRRGLIDQLSSEYGDGYLVSDATRAVDSLDVDWNDQAARSAAEYLAVSGFSCQGLIDQLTSAYGSQYTAAQARYGASRAGIC